MSHETNPAITVELSRSALEGSFPGDLGIEFTRIDDEACEARIVVDRRHLHPGGFVHGGVWTALADTAAAWACYRHLPEGHGFTTSELKVNLFASAKPGDEMLASAESLHIGGRLHVWQVRIDVGDRLAAHFVCTQVILPGASSPTSRQDARY